MISTSAFSGYEGAELEYTAASCEKLPFDANHCMAYGRSVPYSGLARGYVERRSHLVSLAWDTNVEELVCKYVDLRALR